MLFLIIIGLRKYNARIEIRNPTNEMIRATIIKPLCPEFLSLKYGKRRLMTLENPRLPNCAKSIEKDTSNLRSPISSVDNILGKSMAVVIKPIPTPIYE